MIERRAQVWAYVGVVVLLLTVRPATHAAEEPGTEWLDTGFGMATECYEGYGDPSPEEQELLEHMNRARRDPIGEGDRLATFYLDPALHASYLVSRAFRQSAGIDELTPLESRAAFAALEPAPPLVFQTALNDAARAHSQLMSDLDQQTFQADGEPTQQARVEAAGYPEGAVLTEFIYGYGRQPLNVHGLFALDFGQPVDTTSGVPTTPHRDVLMDPAYLDVGIGIVNRQPTVGAPARVTLGPKVVTIDFAQPVGAARYVTGVCFEDLDGDGAYARDEGLAGIRVETDATTAYAITTAGGGYAIPVAPELGTVRVRAIAPLGDARERFGVREASVVVGADNVKADFVVQPLPPTIHDVTREGLALLDAATTTIDLPLAIAPSAIDRALDVEVAVQITHAERSDISLVLESPDGRRATLVDDVTAGADLVGTFPRDLMSSTDLRAFTGAPVSGTWRLHVTDAAAGATGLLERVSLRVRSEDGTPTPTPPAGLRVGRVALKFARRRGRDRILVHGEFDADARLLDPALGAELRIRPVGADSDLVRIVLDGDRAANARLRVKSKVRWNRRGTSRTTFSATIKRLTIRDIPEAVVVELHAGGAVVSDTIALGPTGISRGPFAGPLRGDPDLNIGIERVTTARGMLRIRAAVSLPPDLAVAFAGNSSVFADGRFYIDVGGASLAGPIDPAPFGRRFWVPVPLSTYAVSPAHAALFEQAPFATLVHPYEEFRQVTFDLRRGVLDIRVPASDVILDDGTLPIRLRIGSRVTTTRVRLRQQVRRILY